MTKNTGNSIFLKQYNRRQLLRLVRELRSVSCTQLSKLSGLTPKSVYEICSGLISEEYLFESSIGASRGGRKPILLSIKPNSYYSIGIDIELNQIKTVLMDITGSIKDEFEMTLSSNNYSEYLIAVYDCVLKMLADNCIEKNRLLGIGLSVAGFIDSNSKHIVMAPNLGWENRDIISDLKEKLDCEIYLENEAMASAVCEKWIGDCINDENFICINIKSGIGAGLFASNKPFHGAKGSAGEIGHISIVPNGPLCGCKNRGCLEVLASSSALIKNAQCLLGENASLDALICLAQEDNKEALKIFNDAAEYIGLAILFLVNAFNPSKIIMGKDFVRYAPFELDKIVSKVNTLALKPNASAVSIKVSQFGERSSVLGAALLPQKEIF